MITSTDTKIIYDGDGTTTAFPYTFGIIDASNIQVVRIDSDGSEHLLSADYYVDVANGNVNYPGYAPGSAPPVEEQPPVLPVNSKLCIYRSVPQTQITDLPSTYPLSVIEASLDKLTMLLQEVGEITGRSLKLSIGNGAGIDMVLPVEAGKTFKWAADGKSLVLTDDPAVVYEVAVNLYQAVQAAVSATEAARDAAISATEAARDAAILARNNANTSAINAANSEGAAEASAIAAAGHEANALSYKSAAELAATNAGNSETAVHDDAVAAALSESNALSYKSSAQTSASNAATSESNALTYKNSAGASATAADASADAAALSESNALSYKNSAQASASNAATSETNAGNSATAANNSAIAAALSESNALSYKNTAQTAAGNAATSESNALSYKNSAQTSAGNAATSESNALSYKNAAQGSADAAAASALAAEQWSAVIDPDAYEPTLGSPDVDGKVLSSTTSGVRSWIFPTADLSNYYTKAQTNALIPTTLPASDVSAWAKAATKPSYTYSEVGAAAYSHGHTVSQISDFPASMPASDVYAWAKASSKPSYTYTEVGAAASSHGHTVSQISDFPASMPASDVYSWAKAASKPSYTASEVGLGNVTNESKGTMFTNPTFTGKTTANVVEVKQALGTISTNTTIDTASGDIVTATLGAAITIGITANASASTCLVCTLILTNGGAYTITWNSAIKWAGGTAPTLTASGVDVLHFMTVDNGTTWYGCLGGKGFA